MRQRRAGNLMQKRTIARVPGGVGGEHKTGGAMASAVYRSVTYKP